MALAGKAVSLRTIIRNRREEEKSEDETFRIRRDTARRNAFLKERAVTLRALPPEQHSSFYDAEKKAGEAKGHTFTITGSTMDDTPQCSCGWKGHGYWDGADLAYNDWLWHLLTSGVPIRYPAAQTT